LTRLGTGYKRVASSFIMSMNGARMRFLALLCESGTKLPTHIKGLYFAHFKAMHSV